MRLITSLIAAAALVPALAQADAIKVGIANDISGPFSALGAEARDGFNLAIKQLGGAGRPARRIPADRHGRQSRPGPPAGHALPAAREGRFLHRPDRLERGAGRGPRAVRRQGPLPVQQRAPASSPAPSAIRTGSAPRTRTTPSTRPPARSRPTAASRRCSSWPRLSGGQGRAQRLQARLQGRPGDEVYTKLGQIDYAAELAQIRAAKPDAVYIFLPGGMGINFVKQFVSAGLSQSIKLIGPLRPMRT